MQRRLKYVAQIVMGQSPPSDSYNYEGAGTPFLQGCAEFGERHPLPTTFTRSATKQCIEGDVLFSVRAPVGAMNIADMKYGIGRGLCAIRATDLTTSAYLRYALQEIVEPLRSVATGSTYEAVTISQVGATSLHVHDLVRQHRIATFLDRKTAAIDALIEKKERLIELLQEKRQALITQAVTKGLDPSKSMKGSGKVIWEGTPTCWDLAELRRIIRKGTSITYGIVQAGPHVQGGIPYIKTGDMSGDKLPLDGYQCTSKEIDASYQRSKVVPGDIVVAIRATIGKALPVPVELNGANLTQGTAKISPGPRLIPDFLLLAVQSTPAQNYFDSVAKGSTFREITLAMLRRLSIPVPPLADQRSIVTHVEAETGRLDACMSKQKQSIERLREYRQALISAAVSGELEIPEHEGLPAGPTPAEVA